MDMLVQASAWVLAIVCALLAGVYFAFSTFIMDALARVGTLAGIEVMQKINFVIVRSPFIILFAASTFAAIALAIAGLRGPDQPQGLAMAAGGAVYLIGMFGVTVLFNVPLNNTLAALDPAGAVDAAWSNYLSKWTAWNHIRTAACLLASLLFCFAAAR